MAPKKNDCSATEKPHSHTPNENILGLILFIDPKRNQQLARVHYKCNRILSYILNRTLYKNSALKMQV